MFASRYFPGAYFPKTYFPECTIEAVVTPATAGNWNNLPKWNKRRVPTVSELLERERQEREKAFRETYDGKSLPIALLPEPSVFVQLSEKTRKLIDELNALQPQPDPEEILRALQERVRRLLLLGFYE